MSKKSIIHKKNSLYKALCCIILLAVMILLNSFFANSAVYVADTLNSGTDTASETGYEGGAFSPRSTDMMVTNFTLNSGSDATNCLIKFHNGTDIANVTVAGGIALFPEPYVQVNQNQIYYAVCWKLGGSYTKKYSSLNTYNITRTNILITGGCNGATTFPTTSDVLSGINTIGTVTGYYTYLFPKYTINSPSNYYNSTNTTVNFNISTIDLNAAGMIKNVTLYIDGVANETNTTQTANGTYIFSKTLNYGNHNWSALIFNNNSASNQTTTNFLTLGIFENSRTYSNSITEGSSTTFVLNVSTGSVITSSTLYYNGTAKTTTLIAGDFTTITSSFSVPLVTATTNISFYWVLNYSGGSWTSTSNNQTIYNFNIDNCSTNKLTFVNFTIKDEQSQTVLNATSTNSLGKINLQIFPFADRTQFYNYSTTFNRTNPYALCFNATLFTGEKYSFDLETEYSADNYVTEFYNIQNETLSNSYYNTNISLYLLSNAISKTFKIIYKDSGYKAVEDAIIKIYRKYSGDTETWKITEIPITDYNGQTTSNLVENNVVYSFYVYKYGTLLNSFENVFVKCQYSSIDQCTLNLNDFSSAISIIDFEENIDFNFTLGYNETTRIISSTFNIPSGTSHLISLVVKTDDSLETSVCTDSLTSSSGTVSCTVPNTFGNSTITAKLYKDGIFQSYGNIKLDQKPSDIYGGSLVILGLLMLFSLVGASLTGNPVIMIVSFLIGIIALVSLNLVANNGFLGAASSILFLVVAIIIVLIKMGRRN